MFLLKFIYILLLYNVNKFAWAQQQTCLKVHNTTYYCLDPIINSAVVNVTCPPQYYVRIQNASIYRAIGVSSCQPDMNNPSGAVCSLFNGVNDFMQSLLNACSMKSTCAVMAYPPFPPVTNCSNAIGATYAQVTYRCEAIQNINGTAYALAMTSNSSFSGNLINIDSTPLALTGKFISSCPGTCQLTVPAATEVILQVAVFIKANPVYTLTCDQHIRIAPITNPQNAIDICSSQQGAVSFPCNAVPVTYDISYVTNDPSALVIFVIQVFVHYTTSTYIYCGIQPSMTSSTTSSTASSATSTTTTSMPTSSSTWSSSTSSQGGFSSTTSTPLIYLPTTSIGQTMIMPSRGDDKFGLNGPIPLVIGLVFAACIFLILAAAICICLSRRGTRRATKKVIVTNNSESSSVIIEQEDILKENNGKPSLSPASAYADNKYANYLSPSGLLGMPYGQSSVDPYAGGLATTLNSAIQMPRNYLPSTNSISYNSAPNLSTIGYSVPNNLVNLPNTGSFNPAYLNTSTGSNSATPNPTAVQHLRPTTVIVPGDNGLSARSGDVLYPSPGQRGGTVVFQ